MADRSKSSNAGAEVGVGVVVGAQTGVYVYAEASVGSSKANSDSNTWQNTTLTGQNISLKAEGDTTLRGATATADRIDVKTGGTLTIESLQDMAESMSKNSQVGGRVQVAFGNAWNADGYASAGKAEGSYQGVGQQSGLFAGNGGYHVDAGHVNLIGGAISSTNAANSELTAQTLTFSDLQNQMDYSASSGSISGGAGGKMNGWDAKEGTTAARGGPGMPMSESGSDSSSTLATLTEGNITIGGKQTTAAELGINTDASAAHRALEALPDASKLLADQQAMAAAAGTVLSTSQQIANDIGSGANRITDKYREGLSVEERRVFDDLPSEEQFNRLKVFDPSYPEALVTQQKWAPDGVYGRALGAVTTALVGGMSGQGLGQLGSNALAPYAAELIGKTFDPNKQSAVPSEAMQMLSHALLGALLAEANGGSAGSGALAAGGGELAAKFLGDYYAKQNKGQLTPEQVAQVGALGQAVGVLAGSIAGDELFGVALGANLAKNSVDNNYLDAKQLTALAEEREECKGNEACENSASERWAKVSKLQGKEMWATCQLADGACDLQFAQAWAYGKTDVGHLGLGLDQATSKELVMRFLETAAGKPYRGGTGSFFLQMGKGAVDTASELVTGGLGYALALGDLAFAPQYHRDPATGEFKYERMIVGTPFFGDTSGNPIEAGGYKIGNLAGVDLALFGAAWKSGKVATAKPGGAAAGIGSAGDPAKLRTQLIAEEIAAGHAFEKHVLVQGEFAGLGVRTRKQFAEHIESVVSNPSSIRYYADGRVVYLQESTKTVVFRNPAAEGTAFRPADWNDYISKLPKRTDPPGTGGK